MNIIKNLISYNLNSLWMNKLKQLLFLYKQFILKCYMKNFFINEIIN